MAFALPDIGSLRETELLLRLGHPQIAPVMSSDGKPLDDGVPHYVVEPTTYPIGCNPLLDPISRPVKIIDFGQAFFDADPPKTLLTPHHLQTPEVIFGDTLDHRVDLWSSGSLVGDTEPAIHGLLISSVQPLTISIGFRALHRPAANFLLSGSSFRTR